MLSYVVSAVMGVHTESQVAKEDLLKIGQLLEVIKNFGYLYLR